MQLTDARRILAPQVRGGYFSESPDCTPRNVSNAPIAMKRERKYLKALPAHAADKYMDQLQKQREMSFKHVTAVQ